MLFFSVGNVALKDPRYWQRRNERLRNIGNGAINNSAILATAQWTPPRHWKLPLIPTHPFPPHSSPPPFPCLVTLWRPMRIHWGLYKENGKPQFSLWKSWPAKVRSIPAVRCISFSALGIRFRIANCRTRWHFNFKGLLQDWFYLV